MIAVKNADGTLNENANSVANRNPIRYRGYVYDTDTGFYYLQSRYYDPAICRFINADSLVDTSSPLGFNVFAYCSNNPVNMSDPNGHWPKWATACLVVGAILCIAAVSVLTCGVGTATLVGAIAVGAAKGALIGAAVGTAVGAAIGGATTGTLEGAAIGAATGLGVGAVVGAVVGGLSAGIKFGTFSSKSSLTNHFSKHKSEFGDMYENVSAYANDAKYVVKNGTYIPEKNAYIKFLGNNGRANYAFVGMKSGGRISTYHVEHVSKLIQKGITLFEI